MKVYIGPYPDRVRSNIHSNYMDKKYGRVDWPETYTLFETSLEKIENSLQWFYNNTINRILDNRERKKIVRIDNYDTWSMDHTLSMIVVPLLKKLKSEKHGYPITDPDDAPHIGKGTDVDQGSSDSLAEARWDWILSEMIWAWEQLLEDEEFASSHYYDKYADDEVVEDSGFISEQLRREIGKFNREKYKAYEDRKQNGYRLFGKYLQSLWD